MPGDFGKEKDKRYGVAGLLGLGKSKKPSASGSGYVESSLPWWVYIVSILILLALVFGLYSCL